MKFVLGCLLLFVAQVQAFCPLSQAEPVKVRIHHQQQVTYASVNLVTADDAKQRLELVKEHGPLLTSFDLSDIAADIRVLAKPLAEDWNLDGIADHLWLLGIDGRLWRLSISDGVFGIPRLMADLSDSGLFFGSTIALIRARLPRHLAPASWRSVDHHQLLLVGTEPLSGKDVLFNLRFDALLKLQYLLNSQHLLDRTLLSEPELKQQFSAADWRTILSAAGWKVSLPGRISSMPKVIAGVIYAPVVTSEGFGICHANQTEQLLFAFQLYTATQVYRQRSWKIPVLDNAVLKIREQPDKTLALVLQDETHYISLLDGLLKISHECHQCTAPLTLDRFPLWQRLATYRDERGAF